MAYGSISDQFPVFNPVPVRVVPNPVFNPVPVRVFNPVEYERTPQGVDDKIRRQAYFIFLDLRPYVKSEDQQNRIFNILIQVGKLVPPHVLPQHNQAQISSDQARVQIDQARNQYNKYKSLVCNNLKQVLSTDKPLSQILKLLLQVYQKIDRAEKQYIQALKQASRFKQRVQWVGVLRYQPRGYGR